MKLEARRVCFRCYTLQTTRIHSPLLQSTPSLISAGSGSHVLLTTVLCRWTSTEILPLEQPEQHLLQVRRMCKDRDRLIRITVEDSGLPYISCSYTKKINPQQSKRMDIILVLTPTKTRLNRVWYSSTCTQQCAVQTRRPVFLDQECLICTELHQEVKQLFW